MSTTHLPKRGPLQGRKLAMLCAVRLSVPGRHPRLNAWLRWWTHVAAALALASLLAGVALPRLHGAAELTIYRLQVQELGETIRAMHARAQARRYPVILTADLDRRAFQVTGVYERPARFGRIERMIWMPRGLDIVEASTVTADPSGPITPATITVAAPAYNRIFHVQIEPHGRVTIREETAL